MDRIPILDIKIEANGPAVHMQGENAEVLAPYLYRNQFVGEGHDMADGLHILFFEIGEGKQNDGGTQTSGEAKA